MQINKPYRPEIFPPHPEIGRGLTAVGLGAIVLALLFAIFAIA